MLLETVLISIFGVFIIGILSIVAYMRWDKSFRNKAMIARQTGENVDDVIWITTRFKVMYHDGVWKIHFRHLKEKTISVEGKFWTKFGKPRVAEFTDTQWKTSDMTKLIQRGLYLYETSEGVFYPMKIDVGDKKASFRVIDQDNRLFLINEIANIDMLTRDTQRMMLTVVAIVVGIVVLGAVFFGGMYYLNKTSTAGIAENAGICAAYAKDIMNMTLNPSNNYIGNIPLPGG